MSNVDELGQESMSLGRIDLEDLKANPDIIREMLDEKINFLLDKYGYGFQINGFQWNINGLLSADIVIVKKPEVQN